MVKITKGKVILKRFRRAACAYCTETNLHGFRYITHPQSSYFKSIFWGAICAVSTCLCVFLIYTQYAMYRDKRITTTIETTSFPIWQVPFPAVSICNYNVVYKSHTWGIRRLLENNNVSSNGIEWFLTNLSSLVVPSGHDDNIQWEQFRPVVQILEDNGYHTDKLMAELAQPCQKLLHSCYWKTKRKNCSDLFKVIKTNEGYCCSFNFHNSPDKLSRTNIYVPGTGPHFGLQIYMNLETNQYISPIKKTIGIDIVVHESNDHPDMFLYSTSVDVAEEVTFSIKPMIVESEPSIRNMDVQTRGCVFDDEVQLEWTPAYTYSSCITECKAKAIIALCNCVPFYYPVKGGVRFCNYMDLYCLRENRKGWQKLIYSKSFEGHAADTRNKVMGNTKTCQCYAQCNEVTYTYQMDNQYIGMRDGPAENISILNVYFSQIACTKILRSVFITWESVLGSIGGLIGLCLGGSILSIIEFSYHAIENIIFKLYQKPRPKPLLYPADFNKTEPVARFRVQVKSRH